ncbi:MAG: hypothetical protein QOE28_2646 [Solirubrobacteraceae bacterium]|nr:hypothetical protein [Solirubrobacteraceae bacterium]
MDWLNVVCAAIAATATALATTFGLLQERVDLMFVFVAYGAGTVMDGLIAALGSLILTRGLLGPRRR